MCMCTRMQVLFLVFTIGWAADSGGAFGIVCMVFWFCNMVWYTWEWITSGTRRFLSHRKQEMNVYAYVQQLRLAEPAVAFHAVCWHMETRTRTVYHSDGRGGTYASVETYQEMVVTHERALPPAVLCCAATACVAMRAGHRRALPRLC